MELIEIESGCLYAIRYEGEKFDEYNRIFEQFSNLDYVLDFFETYKDNIGQYYVDELGLDREETEAFAQYVVDETIDLEEYIEQLIDNTLDHDLPDLKGHFKLLEGFEAEKMPALKSYGLQRPSLLRIYAIEVDRQCLVIFYGGIKIRHSISECPVLKDNVIQKARQTIEFLKSIGVLTAEDLANLAL